MDREDLDRKLAEEGRSMEARQGGKHTKKWLAAAAIALILAGVAGGYMMHGLPFLNAPAAESRYKVPDAQPSENFELPAVRNTAVVEAVKKVGPAVVGITTQIYDRDVFNRRIEVGQSVGSGVIFDKQGYIVTNHHVVGDSEKVNVCLSSGDTVQGTVVGTDASTDLAVVKIDGSDDLPVAEFGDSDHLQVGETAIAIGNPLGLEFQGTVTVGVISALNRTLDDMDQRFKLIQTRPSIRGIPAVRSSRQTAEWWASTARKSPRKAWRAWASPFPSIRRAPSLKSLFRTAASPAPISASTARTKTSPPATATAGTAL